MLRRISGRTTGFALFDLGRIHRLRGQFTMALDYFARALAVPEPERDVTTIRVRREIYLATERSALTSTCPLLKPRLHFLAQQPQRVHHAVVRDDAAAVQLGEDAVEPDRLLQ